jgi:hypothetical protein
VASCMFSAECAALQPSWGLTCWQQAAVGPPWQLDSWSSRPLLPMLAARLWHSSALGSA